MDHPSSIHLSSLSRGSSYHGLTEGPFDDTTYAPSHESTHQKGSSRPDSPIGNDKEITEQLPSPTKPSLYERLFTDSWGLEVISALFGTISLVVLLIVLARFEKKPLSDWSLKLSLNTVISIISQLVQACLFVAIASCIAQLQWLGYRSNKPLEDMSYFDNGSRGPVGSLLLLYKSSSRPLVWLGVLAMLLQVFIGPLAQEALSLSERQINRGTGIIPRSRVYEPTSDYATEDFDGDPSPKVPDPMKLAILTGLVKDTVSPDDVQASSTTGNCTFDAFTSMGVCASVEDVTGDIVKICPETEDEDEHACNYTVKALRDNPPFESNPLYIHEQSGDTLYIGASRISDMIPKPPYPEDVNTVIDLYVIYLPDLESVFDLEESGEKAPPELPENASDGPVEFTIPTGTAVSYEGKLQALKGSLKLCAYTFESSMEFGNTNTSVKEKHTDLDWVDGYVDEADTPKTPSISAKNPHAPETFWMSPSALAGWHALLGSQTFTGNRQFGGFGDRNQYSSTTAKIIGDQLYGSENATTVEDGITSLQTLLDKFAMSMTNSMRSGSIYPSNQTNDSLTYEIYFSIDWSWLIVPILSIPATLIFLVAVIVRGHRLGVPAWKTSTLASLQALNPQTRAALGNGMYRQSTMEKMVARGDRVRLSPLDRSQGKWELVGE
ncbi:MAG: hypothetical protein Q9174_003547 [Haloplaca sp. 1 TL-2023]